ncbi:MAG: cation diffusion facilitator family transporter [Alphaproteobacteria bacterium]
MNAWRGKLVRFSLFSYLDTIPSEQVIRWATYASVSVASLLILFKTFAWWHTASLSLEASLIDSVLDAVTSFINLLAVRAALQPADLCHRFGHGKAESIAGLIQALLIALSACWLLSQVVERFLHPQPIQETDVGLLVTGIAFVLTAFLILYQNYVIRRTSSTAIAADKLHYFSDLLTNSSIMVSLVLTSLFSWFWLDAVLGGIIALYILKTSWEIGCESVHVLMDHELDETQRQKILQLIFQFPAVQGVQELRTRSSGVHKFIQGHLLFESTCPFETIAQSIGEITDALLQAYPEADVILQPIPPSQQKSTLIHAPAAQGHS